MRKLHFFMICLGFAVNSPLSPAAERPTLVKTCDPRPDILPRPFYENHTEYRAQYNRPRYLPGWIAFEISRTSQEAMAFEENYCVGNYSEKHMPPMCKYYMYPKPWEMMDTGARPNPQLGPDMRRNTKVDEQALEEAKPRSQPAQAATPNTDAIPKADQADTKTESSRQQQDAKEREPLVPSPSDR